MNHAYSIDRSRSYDATTNYEKIVVFIVDDSYASRAVLENYLHKLPSFKKEEKPTLSIHCFESGEECLKNMNLKPDIVVLDFYLDDQNPNALDGLSVLKQIKAIRKATEVVIMSNQQNVIITSELFHQGAADYISKEHACNSLVEKSIVRIITQLKEKNKEKINTALIIIFIALSSFLIGLIF